MRRQNFQQGNKLVYLIATPIGNLEEFSPRAIRIIQEADIIACEDTRVTAKLLNFFKISRPLISLREHNEVSQTNILINEILQNNKKVCYLSDAGYPAVSDPGNKLVELLLENNIDVSVISGPSACLNALVGSGLNTEHFYFHGFLNPKEKVRLEELRKLFKKEETLIFYEAPHRIKKTLNNMYQIFGNRKACIARELTKKHEEYIRGGLKEFIDIDEDSLKGEMVIIIEGYNNENSPIISNNDVYKMVKKLTDVGISAKDAIKRVSELTQISKNSIYKIYHSSLN